jgi:hypothetical protein
MRRRRSRPSSAWALRGSSCWLRCWASTPPWQLHSGATTTVPGAEWPLHAKSLLEHQHGTQKLSLPSQDEEHSQTTTAQNLWSQILLGQVLAGHRTVASAGAAVGHIPAGAEGGSDAAWRAWIQGITHFESPEHICVLFLQGKRRTLPVLSVCQSACRIPVMAARCSELPGKDCGGNMRTAPHHLDSHAVTTHVAAL